VGVCLCSGVWSCTQCNTPYDLDEIEQSLIEAAQRKSMAYVLQDLSCEKCKGVSGCHSIRVSEYTRSVIVLRLS